MSKNKIKYAGPSKRMTSALEDEGLYVSWPKKIESEGDLAIEATFYTGCDWEKLVLIDLRDEGDLSTKHNVDAAISNQLDEAYECFDIDEEMKLHMEGSIEERSRRGVPEAARLLEDMQEQESRLKRFSEVAEAVSCGRPIPPEKTEPMDEECIHITKQMAQDIVYYLKTAYDAYNGSGKDDIGTIMETLNRKIGE